MFIMKIHQPGVTVEQIRQVDGTMEFCQEFFDDVPIPVTDVVGAIDDGWTVATRLLIHERMAVGGGSPYTSGRSLGHGAAGAGSDLADLVRARGLAEDSRARQLVAEARVRQLVGSALVQRLTHAMTIGAMPPPAGSIMKLFGATSVMRRSEIGLELAGATAAAWDEGDDDALGGELGRASLHRQAVSLGGGSNEIQRNIISERLLGMPREAAGDRDLPYREVLRGGSVDR
jgi:alkylation response protein AidB-like acyl-CoA dehydrogenase